jgi:hypothetical protein
MDTSFQTAHSVFCATPISTPAGCAPDAPVTRVHHRIEKHVRNRFTPYERRPSQRTVRVSVSADDPTVAIHPRAATASNGGAADAALTRDRSTEIREREHCTSNEGKVNSISLVQTRSGVCVRARSSQHRQENEHEATGSETVCDTCARSRIDVQRGAQPLAYDVRLTAGSRTCDLRLTAEIRPVRLSSH